MTPGPGLSDAGLPSWRRLTLFSKAPISHPDPCGLFTLLWSVVISVPQSFSARGMASTGCWTLRSWLTGTANSTLCGFSARSFVEVTNLYFDGVSQVQQRHSGFVPCLPAMVAKK